MIPDLDGLVPDAAARGEDAEETRLLRLMRDEARLFLEQHAWCASIRRGFLALGIGGVISLWLYRIEPASADVDEWLWVVVGDLPPAYLSAECCPTATDALRGYVAEMQAWVDAVRAKQPLTGLIPVNADPTTENAVQLQLRLDFIRTEILPRYESGDLRPEHRRG